MSLVRAPELSTHKPPRPTSEHPLYTFSARDWRDPSLHLVWHQLVNESSNPSAFFQSPDWCEHLHATQQKASLFTLAAHTGDNHFRGVVPLSKESTTLDYTIGKRMLWKLRLEVVEVLGGQPLLPPEPSAYDALLETIKKTIPDYDCIRMSMVPTNSCLWRYLNKSLVVRESFILYTPDGVDRSRLIEIPPTFDEYLAKFSSKTRSELRRQVRRLSDRGQGLRLQRYETADDALLFLRTAAPVVTHSWQHTCASGLIENTAYWQRKLVDLAQRGVLRSYVLFCNEESCAVELGYQFGDVFHGVQTHYDQRLSRLSPGTVLLYKYLEDLIQHARPRILSFGFADAPYKAFFGNAYSDDITVLLFNKNLMNRLKQLSHSLFRFCVNFVKRRVRRTAQKSTPQ